MDLTQEQYEQKRREVIEKFNKEFIDKNIGIDAMTRQAVEALVRGANPYQIIEKLVEANQKLFNEFVAMSSRVPQPPIMLKKES